MSRCVIALLYLAAAVLAQEAGETVSSVPSNTQAKVVAVMLAEDLSKSSANLKHKIYVDVAGLETWTDKPSDLGSIILYLDDLPLKHVTATVAGPAVNSVTRLAFLLMPDYSDAEEQANWRQILISARRSADHKIALSIGAPGKIPLASNVKLELKVQPLSSVLVYAVLGIFVIGSIILAWKTDLLRTRTPVPEAGRRPYSLARTQMFVWFVLVLIAWCYISLTTQSAQPLSNQVLILIGISGATAITATTADNSKRARAAEKRQALTTEFNALVNRIDGSTAAAGLKQQVYDGAAALAANQRAIASGGGTGVGVVAAPVPTNLAEMEKELHAKENRLAVVRAELARPEAPVPVSRGWFLDVMSDATGMSFDRLQIFVWTVALGVYFLWTSLADVMMPALDNQLLVLMGISSGTYLGFKLPGTSAPEQASAT